MAPLEPQKKVLVALEFFDSDHGEIACNTCHGGNADASDKSSAHEGLVPNPSFSDPEGNCGECHEEIAASAKVWVSQYVIYTQNLTSRKNQNTICCG